MTKKITTTVIYFLLIILNVQGMGLRKDNSLDTISNNEYRIQIMPDHSLKIKASGSKSRIFTSEFTVLYTADNPNKSSRRPDEGFNQEEKVLYKVPTWGREELKEIDPNEHVMDGFDPETDRELERGRTANYFLAAPNEKVTAQDAELAGNRIEWTYPVNDRFSLTASVTLPGGSARPVLIFSLKPKVKGYFSAGYTGAPQVSPEDMDEMWLPMIWQEKRFPKLPYLTEAFLCPLPTALVEYKGVTVGVLADKEAIPFMPIPKSENSKFGIMVRNNQAMAQPALFAPVLGGAESLMSPGNDFTFKAHLVCEGSSLLDTYESIARNDYQFEDYRKNATVTLNKTFENIIDYNMSPYSQFVPELRGCNYATDVPGAVKNITGLHPLSLAIITDSKDIYVQRGRPMIEYGFSRERYLFATNPKINRDGTSARLEGPGVPMSDFAAVYSFSQDRMNNYLNQAVEIYDTPINRSLNLTAQLYGDRWQNAMYLYTATGDNNYLKKAVKGADDYLKARIDTPQKDFNDRDSRGMFFWTSYAPQWMELYLLYEITGKARYLEAARTGAYRYAQFVWFNPVIPDGKVTVNTGGKVPRYRSSDKFEDMLIPEETVEAWQVSEIGLTPESSPTCHGHRGIYLTQYAPWMLRVACDANDKFLHDIARSAVIGRYENFPGYHMNAGRTTGHEKADFPLRSLKELNGVTSMHYNHPWPHAATLMDYLVSDVYYKSKGRLDFPAEYAEGYAYCRSKVYGAKPGEFYDGSDMCLYMPKALAESSNVQINYLAARGDESLYLMLTNQSKVDQQTTIKLAPDLLGISPAKKYAVRVWENNIIAPGTTLINGEVSIDVPAEGLTVLAVEEIQIDTAFQKYVYETEKEKWEKDIDVLDFGGKTYALLFNFGPELKSVYSYTKANGDVFKQVTFHYTSNGEWKSVSKDDYPFEFTVDIPSDAEKFKFRYQAVTVEGEEVSSDTGILKR
jgi:hypothetical protein